MVSTESPHIPPKFVVFEGVDGVGKSTLAKALLRYCRHDFPGLSVASGSFPGATTGTLGEWVYRLQHRSVEGLSPDSIARPALQLLHVAAHVDAVLSWIEQALKDGHVILDRYWWSTYAYSRADLSAEDTWSLVGAELPFWRSLPKPIVIYLTRTMSLKGSELAPDRHQLLERFYGEVIERERSMGVNVQELTNDGELDHCWRQLLELLKLPYQPLCDNRSDGHQER